MIVTLSGENYFLLNAELNKLKAKLGDLGVQSINGREVELQEVKLELSSYSLFSEKRLIILYEPSEIKGFEEFVTELEDITPDSTTVAIIEHTLDKRKSYFKYLQSNTDFKNFSKLNTPMLVSWAQKYATELGGKLSSTDANYLLDRAGDDQLLLSQEITKLILYSPTVTKDTIDIMTEQSTTSNIFELLDAAFSLNTKKALKMYGDQRIQKVEPQEILAMLSWQLNSLAVYMTSKNFDNSEILSKSSLSPFTLNKARQIATKISFGELKTLVRDLANLDLRSKSATYDLDEGLKNFIVGLSF